MASNGQQGKAGTPRGQYAMNSGNPPPRGVSDKAGVSRSDKGTAPQHKSVKGADAKLPKHNAGVKNARGKSSPKS